MSPHQLPDFDLALAIADDKLDSLVLAESHGVVCGLLLQRSDASDAHLLKLLAGLELIHEPAEDLRELLSELRAVSLAQLQDPDMALELWLPDDDQPLAQRTKALGQWCSGFLAALGSHDTRSLEALSEEGKEALGDVAEIARADIGPPEGELQNEEDEQAFAEIVEYLRVVVLLLQEDFRRPEPSDSIH